MKHIMLVLLALVGLTTASLAAQRSPERHITIYRMWLSLATPISADTIYRRWWNEIVAACDCKPIESFDRLEFYLRPGRSFSVPFKGDRAAAHWAGSVFIVIAEAHRWNERAIKHELLHAVLQTDGHPPIFARLRLRATDLGIAP